MPHMNPPGGRSTPSAWPALPLVVLATGGLLAATGTLASCAREANDALTSYVGGESGLFESYAGRECTVVARDPQGKETRYARDCGLLATLARGTAPACGASGEARPAYALLPDRERPMHLCRAHQPPLALGAGEHVRFAVMADVGVGEAPSKGRKQASVARYLAEACTGKADGARGRPCDFVTVPGDLIYPAGVEGVFSPLFRERFEDVYAILPPLPFFLTPGNHDHHGNVTAQVEYGYFSSRWRMPDRSSSIEGLPPWMAVRLLDTTPLVRGEDDRSMALADTRGALCPRAGAGTRSKWRFLVGHHPFYSSGHHGPSGFMNGFVREAQEACGPIVYLSGHEHHQEHVWKDGLHQIVAGGGGAQLKKTGARYENDPAGGHVAFLAIDHGFTIFDVTEKHVSFSFHGLTERRALWTCTLASPDARPECVIPSK